MGRAQVWLEPTGELLALNPERDLILQVTEEGVVTLTDLLNPQYTIDVSYEDLQWAVKFCKTRIKPYEET